MEARIKQYGAWGVRSLWHHKQVRFIDSPTIRIKDTIKSPTLNNGSDFVCHPPCHTVKITDLYLQVKVVICFCSIYTYVLVHVHNFVCNPMLCV